MTKAKKKAPPINDGWGRVAALAQSKGGVGKSTTAMNEAIYLAQQGQLVALIDLGRQRESYDPLWDRRQAHPDLAQVAAWSPWLQQEYPGHDEEEQRIEATLRMIENFRAKGAHVIIDCPPVDSEDSPLVGAVLAQANVVVCPFQGGGNDFKAYGRALTMAHDLKMAGRNPALLAFVNKFSGDNDDKVVRDALQGSGVFRYIGEVARDVAVKRSTVNKKAVWEYKATANGAKEMLAVCARITAYLQGEVEE